jgi:hypothetical protein
MGLPGPALRPGVSNVHAPLRELTQQLGRDVAGQAGVPEGLEQGGVEAVDALGGAPGGQAVEDRGPALGAGLVGELAVEERGADARRGVAVGGPGPAAGSGGVDGAVVAAPGITEAAAEVVEQLDGAEHEPIDSTGLSCQAQVIDHGIKYLSIRLGKLYCKLRVRRNVTGGQSIEGEGKIP